MQFTLRQLEGAIDEGDRAFEASWRGKIITSPTDRQWLCYEISAAVEDEWGLHIGAEDQYSDGRYGMAMAVRERVVDRIKSKGEKFGIVIETIILAAILSWLIQRLLDWFFLSKDS